MCQGAREQNSDSQGVWCREAVHVLVWPWQDGHIMEDRMGTAPLQVPSSAEQRGNAAGAPATASPTPGRRGWGGSAPRLNFIHPSTVSQVAFRIRKSRKYIHRCSLVYLLTLCNLFALICFCLSRDFPF